MKQDNSAVALRSPVAARSVDGYMGDLVAWRFARGGEHAFKAPRDKVRAIFEAAGFGDCLDSRLEDPSLALAEASRQAKFGRGYFAQDFAKHDDDTSLAVGVYYRGDSNNLDAKESGDEMVCCARVRIEAGAIVALDPEKGVPSYADPDSAKHCRVIATEIAKAASLRLTHSLSTELSGAICAAGAGCHWAPFRKAGGVYWVHAQNAPKLRSLLDGLETLGGFWATLQPLFGDSEGRTLKNVSTAATEALEAEIDELLADLKKAKDDGMRSKSVEGRRSRCLELVVRADLYREVIESSHAAIVQRVQQVHREFGKLLDLSDLDKAFEGIEAL